MTPGVCAGMGDERLHHVRNIPDVVSMRRDCYVSFNYHQKRPWTGFDRNQWQPSRGIRKQGQKGRTCHVFDHFDLLQTAI